MFQLVIYVVLWGFWFGFPAAIIRLDARRQQEAAKARGEVDFMDRSLTPYMLTALLCGGLPLIVYFGTTRRSAVGWLIGVGMAVAQCVLLLLLAGGLAIVSKHREVERIYGPNHGRVVD